MNAFAWTIEILATFIEAILLLSSGIFISDKCRTRKQNAIMLVSAAVMYTLLISILNTRNLFSFLTIVIGLTFSILVIKWISGKNLRLSFLSCMLSFFFMAVIDYALIYLMSILYSKSMEITAGFILMTEPSHMRWIYLFIDKLLQAAMFVCFGKKLKLLGRLDARVQWSLAGITTALSFVVNGLVALIMADSVIKMQTALVLFFLFTAFSLIGVLTAMAANSRYQQELREKELMEQNYLRLQQTQEEIRGQIHDFKNHLRAIKSIADQPEETKSYVDNLLHSPSKYATLCSSGNRVIDSIINAKAAEAAAEQILFRFSVILPETMKINSLDLCAILANQLDNALEAAIKITDTEDRFVDVQIWQKEAFVFFRVDNSAAFDPFNEKHELPSSKEASSGLHGLGLRNIHNSVEKYG